MTLHTVPAPARSDRPAAAAVAAARPRFAVHGTMMSVGALAWAASIAIGGIDPVDSAFDAALFGVGSGLFQVGLLFLLRAQSLTRAAGTGKVARTFLAIEKALVGMAILSTLADAFRVSDLDQTGWLLLDMFWPLSMLGMFAIGIRIAIAGRWRGVARFWPLVAESWAVCVIPTTAFGTTVSAVVGIVHLCVGYTVLGLIVARRPDLLEARD